MVNKRFDSMLRVTGEKVVLLAQTGGPANGGGRYLCLLPPQQSGHRPRIQQIRAERLQFRDAR